MSRVEGEGVETFKTSLRISQVDSDETRPDFFAMCVPGPDGAKRVP